MNVIKSLLIAIAFGISISVSGQPGTEIFLFDLQESEGTYKISNPQNVSNNPGYDNQPFFTSDGMNLLYSSQKEDQTEIIKYDLLRRSRTAITNTPGSEYSPTESPDSKFISTIILKKDGEQLLWKYPKVGGKPEVVVPELVIGYHCWYDKKTIYSFVLGEPSTLQISNVKSGENEIIAENIGRSLHKVPGQKKVSYIQKQTEGPWTIMMYHPKSGAEAVIETLDETEDLAWTPSGVIFMGKDSTLYKYSPEQDKEWIMFADISEFGLKGITRLAISPNSRQLAIVVSE